MTITTAPPITITIKSANVVAAAPKGGNARHKGKKRVEWRNNTDRRVGLFFREFADSDDDGGEDPIWVFGQVPVQAGVEVDPSRGVVRIDEGNCFQGTLSATGLLVIKYTVAVLQIGHADPNSIDPEFEPLDPIIIIDR